jgi:predicted ATPase
MDSEFYKNRARRFEEEEKACERQSNRYSWLRLAIMVSAVASGIVIYPLSARLCAAAVVLLLAAFTVCLKKHAACIDRQHHNERLKIINRNELNCLEGDFSAFAPGNQYINAKHDYSSDLDIFGEHSLFRCLNRVTSPSGSDMLAEWLLHPASTPEIKARQQAVAELSGMIGLRQEMQAVGLKHKDVSGELPGFLEWLRGDVVLSGNRLLIRAMQILPWATIAAIIASAAGWLPSLPAWMLVAVHFAIYGSTIRKIGLLHQQVSCKVQFISTYSELIGLAAGAKFSSPYLAAIRGCFIETDALRQIRLLRNRVKRLDYRLNMMFAPLNILFFFDYKHLVWLERWRSGAGQKLPQWFDALAKIEALSGFANALHNNPNWAMPVITDEYFTLRAENMGHPLILENERVCNDFSLTGAGRIAIVTGSNMSGKSTFERSAGVNMALALAGAAVCADAFTVTNCRLYSYMRIADDLRERASSFYAELKRLKKLIDIARDGRKVFFLLDEVLRGTNSRDRQIGSMALVRQLAGLNVSGIIATHDLALGELERELPDNVCNSHFDVRIDGEDMSFDYRLRPGICDSLNASILMKKIGIDVQ